MTTIDVWSAAHPEDRGRWLSALEEWSDAPPAAFPSYLELFAPEGRLVLLHRRTGPRTTVLPLVLRKVPGEERRLDAIGPYGYGGAFSTHQGPDPEFWTAVSRWAREQQIVSVVVRLPVSGSGHVDWPFDRHDVGLNVVCDVADWDSFWHGVDRKVRKNHRRATEAGLRVEQVSPQEGVDDFLDLYLATMTRRESAGTFLLGADRVRRLLDELGSRASLFFTREDGRWISTELVLRDATTAYSFLGGTDESRFELRPNDLLKCEIVRWAGSEGLTHYVLGGGVGGSGDGIFRYKKAFAPHGVVPFAIGEWVVDPSSYSQLVHRAAVAGAGGWPRYRTG